RFAAPWNVADFESTQCRGKLSLVALRLKPGNGLRLPLLALRLQVFTMPTPWLGRTTTGTQNQNKQKNVSCQGDGGKSRSRRGGRDAAAGKPGVNVSGAAQGLPQAPEPERCFKPN
ncbi:MAG: hypothetical protein K8R36_13210, partial [Planctomycetales bacterium]|nr:hypothetical protein [Planctomycetales bacterium]